MQKSMEFYEDKTFCKKRKDINFEVNFFINSTSQE